MKNLLLLIFLPLVSGLHAQYYYKDIIGTRETNAMMKRLVDSKVKRISLKSYDADGSITEDFFIQQWLSQNPHSLKTITRIGDSDESILISIFDDQARLIRTIDSSGGLVNYATYDYDKSGNLVMIKTWSTDSTGATINQEQHDWSYSDGRVNQMIRSRNNAVIDEIRFIHDEDGNPVEEETYKNGKLIDRIFYYYNDKNLLTDIVSRYNVQANMLLPDYMFEYSPAGLLLQKITVPPKGSNYIIWRYQYDEKGIKIKEAIFDRYKQLQGRIDYQYGY